EVLQPLGGLVFLKPGDRVVVKANLITFLKPDKAATTHPVLLSALTELLRERGAEVVIGDSPGGPFSLPYLKRVYAATGLTDCEKAGATLNQNTQIREADFSEARVMKHFTYTAYLDDCDYIIDFCKLKTHGMMGLTGGCKNMFGAIPGTDKPEYHYRYPNPTDFSRMLVDINAYFKPVLTICDGVMAMEGNGPSMGKPRKMGLLAASKSPHQLDLVLAALIHMKRDDVPTLMAAFERGLIPAAVEELSVTEGWEKFICPDFETIGVKRGILFTDKYSGIVGKLWAGIMKAAVQPRPQVKGEDCIGCGECAKVCPAKAITMVEKKPSIDYKKCIRCFCCQEFCPIGAMKVRRTIVSKLLERIR
ncbi:MAG: DUF362 domain-containing protein, partial [Clostridia bacterium]|nr:DUF362 domain-containing protein [Clostridia bacterium]